MSRTFTPGQFVFDTAENAVRIVAQDYGRSHVIVSSIRALDPDATMIDRATWPVPRGDLELVKQE